LILNLKKNYDYTQIIFKNRRTGRCRRYLLPDSLFAATEKSCERVGVQLYSVRDAMKADPKGTLKKIADAGYHHVEHANYIDSKFYGYTAKSLKSI
jgi:hypothetical protein